MKNFFQKFSVFVGKFFSFFIKSPLSSSVFYKTPSFSFESFYNDPWPGDAIIGQNFLYGHFDLGHKVISLADFMNALAAPDLQDNKTLLYIHSFEWIREFRCISDNASRRLVRQFIDQWITCNGRGNKKILSNTSWEPYLIGARLSNALSFFDFYGISANDEFLQRLKISLNLQFDILNKQYRYINDPIQKTIALKGLILCSLVFKIDQKNIKVYLKNLEQTFQMQIYLDGGHKSKDPFVHIYILKELVDIRSALRQFHYSEPEFINEYIKKMVPLARLFRHGDGELTEFVTFSSKILPSRGKPSQAFIDMLLSIADVKGRPAIKAPDMGYERLNTKSGQLIINTKPNIEVMESFCGPGTGILNFEWSFGEKRHIQKGDIVIQTKPNQWIQVPTIKGTPQIMRINRQVKEGEIIFEADFESVVPISKVDKTSTIFNLQRQLYLGGNDGDFRGKDRILLSTPSVCAIRFIFAQGIEIATTTYQNQQGALIKIFAKESQPKKNTVSRKKENHTLWRFLSSPVEEISIQKNPDTGQTALFLIQHIKADKPKIIKWAFHKQEQ